MAGLTFYGASWCPDCRRTKHWLGEHHVDYDWVDIDKDPAAAAKVRELNEGNATIPTLVFADGSVLALPSNADLARKLGVAEAREADYMELAIVGAGPAGLSAAIYTTREDIATRLYEVKAVGGLAGITDHIDNYPGFADGVSGLDLSEQMEKQARRFGAEIQLGVGVQKIVDEGRYKRIMTPAGAHLVKSVLITTGTDYKKLGVPGEREYTSRGVHYCATCDGPFYRGKRLVVVGGGNSAMQESIFLTKFATSITMLVRGPQLRGSEILMAKVRTMPQVEIVYNTVVDEIVGDGKLVNRVKATDKAAGRPVEFETDGVFVFIGLIPNTAWLKGTVDLDEYGFIKTDRTFETSLKGVFAAGDVRSGATLQIASAVGEGAAAALMIREYLKEAG